MNVLPFVIVIIALFAGLNATFFLHSRTLMLTEQSYKNYMQAERCARIDGVNNLYKKIKAGKQPKPDPKPKKIKPVKALRNQPQYASNARLNVYSWFISNEPDPKLAEYIIDLCNHIYGNIPEFRQLAKQGKIKAFFEEIAISAKSCKAESFDSIRLKKESSLFYKMCRGTSYFDMEKGIGYPPLDQLFRLDEKSAKTPLRWRIATPRMLSQFLGNDLAEKILKAESTLNQQGKQFDKKELDDLIGQDAFIGAKFEAVQSGLDHSCGKLKSKTITISNHHGFTKIDKRYISIP